MLGLKIAQRQLYETKINYNIAFVEPGSVNSLYVIPEIEEFGIKEAVIMCPDMRKISIKKQLLSEFPQIVDTPIVEYNEEEKMVSVLIYSSEKLDEIRLKKIVEDRIEEMSEYTKVNNFSINP